MGRRRVCSWQLLSPRHRDDRWQLMGVPCARIDRIGIHCGHFVHPSGLPTYGVKRLFFSPCARRTDPYPISLVLALLF